MHAYKIADIKALKICGICILPRFSSPEILVMLI